MPAQMTIGDFSRATRLTAKALRFYHQERVLVPAAVDPDNGYRLYAPEQIADANVVRQLRALEIPVGTIREVMSAPDLETRTAHIAQHLARLESHLEETRAAVATLRGLVVDAPPRPDIEHRSVLATPAVVVRETIDLADLGPWYDGARAELHRLFSERSLTATGPLGGLWSTELFLDERGEAALFLPVASLDRFGPPDGRATAEILPAVDLAVVVHRGIDEEMGRTYGALGAYVAEHELGVEGPIREHYLEEPSAASPQLVTEIGWPIFRVAR